MKTNPNIIQKNQTRASELADFPVLWKEVKRTVQSEGGKRKLVLARSQWSCSTRMKKKQRPLLLCTKESGNAKDVWVLIFLFKRKETVDNARTTHTHTNNKISLIHQPSKDMVKVIQNDISTTTVELPAEVQAGLKPGRSTIEQILNVTSKQDRITTKYTLFINKVERQYGVRGYESDVKINLEKVEIVIKGNINFRQNVHYVTIQVFQFFKSDTIGKLEF